MILQASIYIAFAMMSLAMLLNLWRLLRGPDVPDRIVALDTLFINTIALLVLGGIHFEQHLLFRIRPGARHDGIHRNRRLLQIPAARRHHRIGYTMLIEIVISFFLLVGASFALIGSIGLMRLPDFFTRLHGPTKSTTLGVGGMLVASIIYFSLRTEELSLHELLVALFLFMTAPVSAHLLAKAALHHKVHSIVPRPGERDEDK